jgi:hypothetical protein
MCELYGDSDGPAFYERTARCARKAHICDSCDGRIAAGERYFVESFVAERGGKAESQKCCSACDADRDTFSEAHDDEFNPLPTYFREALWHCIAEEPESAARWQPMLDAMAGRKAAA